MKLAHSSQPEVCDEEVSAGDCSFGSWPSCWRAPRLLRPSSWRSTTVSSTLRRQSGRPASRPRPWTASCKSTPSSSAPRREHGSMSATSSFHSLVYRPRWRVTLTSSLRLRWPRLQRPLPSRYRDPRLRTTRFVWGKYGPPATLLADFSYLLTKPIKCGKNLHKRLDVQTEKVLVGNDLSITRENRLTKPDKYMRNAGVRSSATILTQPCPMCHTEIEVQKTSTGVRLLARGRRLGRLSVMQCERRLISLVKHVPEPNGPPVLAGGPFSIYGAIRDSNLLLSLKTHVLPIYESRTYLSGRRFEPGLWSQIMRATVTQRPEITNVPSERMNSHQGLRRALLIRWATRAS